MADHHDELLATAELLLEGQAEEAASLVGARARRSISTSYYALFHFLLDELGRLIVGVDDALRSRRQVLARTVTHAAVRVAMGKVAGRTADQSAADLLRAATAVEPGAVPIPVFVREIAATFINVQSKREEADYDLRATLSRGDALAIHARVAAAIRGWREADTPADRDIKAAVLLLVLVRGQLRSER